MRASFYSFAPQQTAMDDYKPLSIKKTSAPQQAAGLLKNSYLMLTIQGLWP